MGPRFWRRLLATTGSIAILISSSAFTPLTPPVRGASGNLLLLDEVFDGSRPQISDQATISNRIMDGDRLVGVQVVATFGDPGEEFGFSLAFHAPTGKALTVGAVVEFDGAPTATKGSMDVLFCGSAFGRFTVLELGPTAFAVDFTFRCVDWSYTTFGSFRSQSTIGLRALSFPLNLPFIAEAPVAGGSSTATFVLTSRGSIATTVNDVAISGPAAADFAISGDTCTGVAIAPGATCAIEVTADPSQTGPRLATLTVEDDTLRGSRSTDMVGFGTAPASRVHWSGTTTAGPNHIWNNGHGLGRTSTATSSYLHSVASTDRVGGAQADDNGPYVGVVYSRRSEDGTTWSGAKRLNSTAQHGDRSALATSGPNVFVTWVRTQKVVAYDPAAPRVVYFRRNSAHGSSTAWLPAIRLTSTTSQIDWPTIAASGANVYIAYTNSSTGDVRLVISRDRGRTWTKKTVGSSSDKTADGYEGRPVVAAAGARVLVTWTADRAGAVKARISGNDGFDFGPTTVLAKASSGPVAAKARDSRLAVAWPKSDGVAVRIWHSATGWAATQSVGPVYDRGRDYRDHATVAVSLGASGQVGVAWSACWQSCSRYSTATRVDTMWAESKTDGAAWFRPQLLGSASATSARRISDAPAISWPTANRRDIVFNGWRPDRGDYRLYLVTGTGLP